MKPITLALSLIASLALGIIATGLYFYNRACSSDCEPDASYVVEWNGAHYIDNDGRWFKDALRRHPAKFRHNMTEVKAVNDSPQQPDEYKDLNIHCTTLNLHNKIGGLHLTQRAGFNNSLDAQAVLKYLKD